MPTPHPASQASAPRRGRAALLLLAALLVAAPLPGCGGYVHRHRWGTVELENFTDTSTFEDVDAFRMAAFGRPFSGNLLASPLPPGMYEVIGDFRSDYYDAEADLELGDLVEWFDVPVRGGDTTVFEVY